MKNMRVFSKSRMHQIKMKTLPCYVALKSHSIFSIKKDSTSNILRISVWGFVINLLPTDINYFYRTTKRFDANCITLIELHKMRTIGISRTVFPYFPNCVLSNIVQYFEIGPKLWKYANISESKVTKNKGFKTFHFWKLPDKMLLIKVSKILIGATET